MKGFFFFLPKEEAKYAKVFAPGKPYYLVAIFESKSRD
jgi:hypothetical protein